MRKKPANKNKRWAAQSYKMAFPKAGYKWEAVVTVDHLGYGSWAATKKAAIKSAWARYKKSHQAKWIAKSRKARRDSGYFK